MTKEKVITFFEDDDWKQGRQFLLRKNRVTSWVTAPGDTNPSDATVMFSQKLFLWFGLLNFKKVLEGGKKTVSLWINSVIRGVGRFCILM